ncbi:MAG: putative toxin-antitoxin system toxin component, PIN family, partial [Acidimicrobiales bacterium]
RTVIDPNVWVSALINPEGAPARVARAVAEGSVSAVVTEHLLDGLAGVLMRPRFRRWFSVADASAFVEALARTLELAVCRLALRSSRWPRVETPLFPAPTWRVMARIGLYR